MMVYHNSAKRLNNVYRCFSSEAELKVTDHKNIGFNYLFFTEHTAKIEGTLLPCFYYSCIRGDRSLSKNFKSDLMKQF